MFCSQEYQLVSWRRPFAASAGDPAIATINISAPAIALKLFIAIAGRYTLVLGTGLAMFGLAMIDLTSG
jgi:hypothetical protein